MIAPRVPFLDAVADCTGGNAKVQRKDYLAAGDLPVIDQGQDFVAGHTERSNQYSGQLPVVLFGDHTRIFKYVDFPFALGADGVKVLQPSNGFDAKYLFYYFRSVELPNAGYSRHFKFLKEIDVPKPSLTEQRRIVDLLSRAEGIVRLRREAEKLAAELIPALFLEMFSKIDKSCYQQAAQLCDFITKGTTPKTSEITTSNDGDQIPFLKVLHIEDDGQVDFERQPSFISKELHRTLLARSVVRPNDVLMNIVGPPLGRICLVPATFPEWNINQALAIFRPKPGLIPTFLFHALRSPIVLPKILQLPVGVRQLNISLEQCRNIEIPVPPESEQRQFVLRADEISAIQLQQSDATAKAQAAFDALLAAAFEQ